MTYQPGEPPYTQPQDPWSGTHGTASAPTEPLPAPVRGPDQFAPGVASPASWSQQTISHTDPPETIRSEGSRAGLYVFVGLLVVVLGGAGGYGSWWLTSRYAGQLAGSPTTTATATAEPIQSATARPTEFRYDADLVRVGDCLVNRAPEGADPDMWVVPCGRPGSYKVVKIVPAQDIPADMRDTLHLKETAQKLYELLCQDVSANAWYSVNSPNDAKDHFLCMEIAPEV